MRIDVLTFDGSPLGIVMETLWGDSFRVGLGGAELALMTLCEAWHEAGHKVRLFNNPWRTNGSPFEQHSLALFNPNDDRDVLINFRSCNPKAIVAKGMKVWLSCDQYSNGNYADFGKFMDKIVCISPRHKQFFKDTYGLDAMFIDLPVRTQDFSNLPKIPNRFIFTSVPDRGLPNLRRLWPMIRQQIPDASLVITSDYRLWGADEGNGGHRLGWARQEGVRFLGALPRREYLDELAQAEWLVYPCNYDELFCYAVAEAQVAGTYPVTSNIGSLSTTNMGTTIPGDGSNIEEFLVMILHHQSDLKERSEQVKKCALERFDTKVVLDQWDKKVFK